MKKPRWRFELDRARQRFVLTPREKRVLIFILAAFLLGLATKYYRDTHRTLPLDPPKKIGKGRPPGAPRATPARQEAPQPPP